MMTHNPTATALGMTMGTTLAATLLLMASHAAQALEPREVVGSEAIANLKGKTILLAGATGNNGSVVLKQLGDLGLKVRAMTRDAAAARQEFGDRYEWVEADVTRPETLAAATRGVNVVISAVATAWPVGSNRPEKVDYEGTINLARAAKAAGATRFVIITSSSSGQADHFLNYIGGNVLIWKGKAEEALMESGLEYVVVGPTAMTDEPLGTREIRLIPRAEYVRGMTVSRGDTAAVVIAAAGSPAAANRTFSVLNGDGTASPAWRDQFARMPAK
jgi:uncharacterized protein YbjT (DUF2867 family)